MDRPIMRDAEYCRKRETSRFVSWMHKEGYLDKWNPLRWVSQKEIELCRESKTGRPYAHLARENAPYAGGYHIWEPGYYRVKLKIVKGVHGDVGFLSEKCAAGFPDGRRNRLKKQFERDMGRRANAAYKVRLDEYHEYMEKERKREWNEQRKERSMRFHRFDDDSQQFFQSIAMAGSMSPSETPSSPRSPAK